jgi:hypothetical protein
MHVDCTLDNFSVPGFSDIVPEFGIKKPNGIPISSREAHENIKMPFANMRPHVVEENSTTTRVEVNSVFDITEIGTNLTLSNATYNGCLAYIINSSDGIVTVTVNGGGTHTLSNGKFLDLEFINGEWEERFFVTEEKIADTVLNKFALKAPLADPTFTGIPKVPNKTSPASNNGTLIATEAQVKAVAEAASGTYTSEASGRDLMSVLLNINFSTLTTQDQRNTAITQVMEELRRRCNNFGGIDNTYIPDFTGIAIGDYIDGLDLSGITAPPNGTAPQAWNNSYKNNRIIVSGFNTYGGRINILFTFRNIICKSLINFNSNNNNNGFYYSDLRAWICYNYANGAFVTRLASALGVASLLSRDSPIDYLTSVGRSNNNAGTVCYDEVAVFLPSEIELTGYKSIGHDISGVHFPIYARSTTYRQKKYNGVATEYLLQSQSETYNSGGFCVIDANGAITTKTITTTIGISPAFFVF